LTLREWVNSGLMTFFFVVGLEARREFDLGELRQRRRVALPVLAGLGGMIVPVVIFLALNAGAGSRAAARSTLAGPADPRAARHGRDVDRPGRAG
jgi:Na+/H+ antiporter NhaA